MSILVVAEHDGAHARPGSFSALAVARDLGAHSGERVELLVIGSGLDSVAADAARFAPVIVVDSPLLANPTADRYAQIIADVSESAPSGQHRRELDDFCERHPPAHQRCWVQRWLEMSPLIPF